MSYIQKNDLIPILDSFALAIIRAKESFGTGSESNTISKCIKTNLQRILDLTYYIDYYNIIRPLADYTFDLLNKFNSTYLYEYFRVVLNRIWLLQDNNLDDFLSENNIRIHPEIRDIYINLNKTISPSNVMCPPITNLGTYTISDGNGSFTDGNNVNTTLYGPAPFKVKPTTQVGENSVTLVITCKTIANETRLCEVEIPGGTSSGTEFNIEYEEGELYIDITNISHTGGNNGDAFQCYSVWERNLTE